VLLVILQTDRQTDTAYNISFFLFNSHVFLYFIFYLEHWVVFKNIFHIYALIQDMYLIYNL